MKAALCAKGLLVASGEASDDEEEKILPTPSHAANLTFAEQKELLLLQLENRKMEHQMQMDRLRLNEQNERAKRELEQQKLELEAERLDLIKQGKMPGLGDPKLDISTSLRLLPPFNEKDVDTFFVLFERVADAQGWPDSHRALMLQCTLTGKAQRAFSALSVEDAKDYEFIKASFLRLFELIPEAYRQRFRGMRRRPDQSNVEFARDLRLQYQRWCVASNVQTVDDMTDLIVLEQFKTTLPERVAIYIAEKQTANEADAAMLVDEYELTHKANFGERLRSANGQRDAFSFRNKTPNVNPLPVSQDRSGATSDAEQVCRYCQGKGHWKGNCPVLKSKAKACYSFVKPAALAVSPFNSDVVLPNKLKPNYTHRLHRNVSLRNVLHLLLKRIKKPKDI